MFKIRELKASDANRSYPLVSFRYPGISLERWAGFVTDPARRGACGTLICLVDSRDSVHAVFAYGLERSATNENLLHVEHIATFRLAGDAIYRAFDEAVEKIAHEWKCREICVVPWSGVDPQEGPPVAPEDVALGRRILSIAPASQERGPLN